MSRWTKLGIPIAVAALTGWLGCTNKPSTPPPATSQVEEEGSHEHSAGEEHGPGEEHDHEAAGEHDGGHAGHAEEGDHEHGEGANHHHGEALTEADVHMPADFAEGVVRLEELHAEIERLIDEDDLLKVHRVAEEMALVARKMKALAQQDLPAEKRTEAGRLCNEVAGYFRPIDDAADSGDKVGTEAVHDKMEIAIGKLKEL
jgi:hypothetical protein